MDTLLILNIYENLFELNNTEFNNTKCSVTEFNYTEFNNTECSDTEFNKFNNLQDHANAMNQYYEENSYCTQNMDTLPILNVNKNFFELDNTVFDNLQNHADIMDHQYRKNFVELNNTEFNNLQNDADIMGQQFNNLSYLRNTENFYCTQIKENTQTMNTLPILDIEKNFFDLNDTEFNNLQDHPNIIVQQQWLDNHGKEYGFTFTITHSKKDKENGIPRRHKYRCMKGRPYIMHKEAHATKKHN
ncbi:1684_t:CDS:2 [Gigaspora margarita]|uniref:1684_t:CDS:1 n=1 Tax=Gigaspora margarita TaxID=4874 RepID=A0ABN7UU47_GIGMA|nr:1684_t:CDS:2 [Gigaspora margarita]